MASLVSAPVAQLDRVSVFETEGWEFKPLRARHFGSRLRTPAETMTRPSTVGCSAAPPGQSGLRRSDALSNPAPRRNVRSAKGLASTTVQIRGVSMRRLAAPNRRGGVREIEARARRRGLRCVLRSDVFASPTARRSRISSRSWRAQAVAASLAQSEAAAGRGGCICGSRSDVSSGAPCVLQANGMPAMNIFLEDHSVRFRREHRNALVTICIGDEYWSLWRDLCQTDWRAYCDKVKLDLIVVKQHLDLSDRAKRRSPAWQKLLLLSQPWADDYERIVWLDSDIVILPSAPDIIATAPDPALIGIVESGAQLSEAERHIYFERLFRTPVDPTRADLAWSIHIGNQFASAGISESSVTMYNTGVMVVNPRIHAEMFLNVYEGNSESRLYEQPHLSLEIHKRNIAHRISARFNWSIHEYLMLRGKGGISDNDRLKEIQIMMDDFLNEKQKAYFLHFCGSMKFMKLLHTLSILR